MELRCITTLLLCCSAHVTVPVYCSTTLLLCCSAHVTVASRLPMSLTFTSLGGVGGSGGAREAVLNV